MSKFHLFLAMLLFVFLTKLATSAVHAGGCCYAFFDSTPGIASLEPATFEVGFIDPAKTYQQWIGYGDPPRLSNQNIEVNIVDPQVDQSCQLNSPTTDENGVVSGNCTSNSPGEVSIYFSVPGYNQIYQSWFSSVKQKIQFSETTDTQISPTTNSEPTPSEPNETITTNTEDTDERIEDLENKIDNIEQEIEIQQEELNVVQRVLRNINNLLSRLFNFRN